MKRLLYAATLAVLVMLILAPAALAQDYPRVQDPSACATLTTATPTGEGDFACLPPCEGIISQAEFEQCVADREAAEQRFAAQVAANQAALTPPVQQPAPVAATGGDQMQQMPDTGGPSLLPFAGFALMSLGTLMFAVRRRIS